MQQPSGCCNVYTGKTDRYEGKGVLAVSASFPSVPVSAEETGTQALAEADGSGMVQQGMVLGAVAAGGMTLTGIMDSVRRALKSVMV